MAFIIDDLITQLTQRIDDAPMDKSQLKAFLSASLSKLDVVARDEFDAQTAVLHRTREKLHDLESQLNALEQQVEQMGQGA